jgi:hypothetical protein
VVASRTLVVHAEERSTGERTNQISRLVPALSQMFRASCLEERTATVHRQQHKPSTSASQLDLVSVVLAVGRLV